MATNVMFVHVGCNGMVRCTVVTCPAVGAVFGSATGLAMGLQVRKFLGAWVAIFFAGSYDHERKNCLYYWSY